MSIKAGLCSSSGTDQWLLSGIIKAYNTEFNRTCPYALMRGYMEYGWKGL